MKKLILLFLMSWAVQSNAMVTSPVIGRGGMGTYEAIVPVNIYASREDTTLEKTENKQKKQISLDQAITDLIEEVMFVNERIKHWTNRLAIVYGERINDPYVQSFIKKTAQEDWVRQNWERVKDLNKKG